MAQDAAAQESGRGNIPTPEVFGTTVYKAIANNNYLQLRTISALSLDLKEMETIGSDIIKVIVTKLNNGGFVDPAIDTSILIKCWSHIKTLYPMVFPSFSSIGFRVY